MANKSVAIEVRKQNIANEIEDLESQIQEKGVELDKNIDSLVQSKQEAVQVLKTLEGRPNSQKIIQMRIDEINQKIPELIEEYNAETAPLNSQVERRYLQLLELESGLNPDDPQFDQFRFNLENLDSGADNVDKSGLDPILNPSQYVNETPSKSKGVELELG